MAFANEVRDFIDAFQVGAKIKDMSKRRKLDEQEAKDKVSIAQMRQDAADKKFNKVYDQNERKLSTANKRWESDYGLRTQEAARRAADSAATQKFRERQLGISEDAAKERKRKAALREDPTRILDEEEPAGALPTGVTTEETTETALPAQGISVSDQPQPKPSGSPGAAIAAGAGAATAMGMGVAPGTVAKALSGGLAYMQNHFGLGGAIRGASPKSQDGARRLFEGEGTMTPEEQQQVDNLLDDEDRANGVTPDKLTDGMRSVRRLTRTYNKLLERGKTDEANAMAASIIQSSRGIASMLGSQAIQKLQSGDVAGAAKDLVTAHDQIPDGRSVKLDEKSMTFTIIDDETGKELEKGQVTPEAIFSMANGMKDGSAFYRIIMDAAKRDKSMQDKETAVDKEAAKVKPEELKARADYAAPEPTENEPTTGSSIQSELMNMKMSDGASVFESPEEMQQAVGPKAIQAISNLGEMITKYNDIPADKAGRVALLLVNPADEGSKSPYDFKLIHGNENVMELLASDGTRVRLPSRVATPLILEGHTAMTSVGQKVGERQTMESQRRVDSDARRTKTELMNRENERRAGNRQSMGIDVGASKVMSDIGKTVDAAGSGITTGLRKLVGQPTKKRSAEEIRKSFKKKPTRVAGGPR